MKGILSRILPVLSAAFVSCTGPGIYTTPPQREVEKALEELDEVIDRKDEIESRKDLTIASIRKGLGKTGSDTARYRILDRLYSEYYQYDIDSAVFYARENWLLPARQVHGS